MKISLKIFLLSIFFCNLCAMEPQSACKFERSKKVNCVDGVSDVVKINDDLYVGKVNEEFYVAMERVSGEGANWWADYSNCSQKIASSFSQGVHPYFHSADGTAHFNTIINRQVGRCTGDLGLKTELWIAYASNKPIECRAMEAKYDNSLLHGSLDNNLLLGYEKEPQIVEMFFSVLTSKMAILTTHVGISRSPEGADFMLRKGKIVKALEKYKIEFAKEIKKNEVKEGEASKELVSSLRSRIIEADELIVKLKKSIERKLGRSMDLHSFAAKVMRIVYPNKKYMLNAPAKAVANIFLKKMPKGTIFVGNDRYKNRIEMAKKDKRSLLDEFDLEQVKEKLEDERKRILNCKAESEYEKLGIDEKYRMLESNPPMVQMYGEDNIIFAVFDPRAKDGKSYLINNLLSEENANTYKWLLLPEQNDRLFCEVDDCLVDLEALEKVGKFELLQQ